MPGLTRNTHFETLQSFEADFTPTNLTQYKSKRTGMQVIAIARKGPKVQGYFTLATEIFDDSGAPHTLEHLIFMGSKSYQYKGVLDKLANRAYSNTNAWTATDHTAYTLDTAGWEGFAQILPVYLEHVVLPTLTDEGCYTEVHHVDGEGHDAGVVYSEMQGIQNTGAELMDLEARRLLYPQNVGFRYETGGMMEQLRVLTADRIRAFHKEMYQPKNLCLVIVGEIDHDNLLEVLDKFEDGILDEVPTPDAPFRRPWIESPQPPPLAQTVVRTVEFPEEDETAGDILIGFLGPNCNDILEAAALNVLLTYLAGSSVSVLENIMVEKEELASSIGTWWDSRPASVIWFQPTSVATERLAEVESRLFEILKDVGSKPLDMSYMIECIKRERRQLKFQAETSHEFFATNAINDFLFGKANGATLKDIGSIQEYDTLETWTDQQWRDYLKHWISDAHHVSILGKPSKDLAEKLKKDELARVREQKDKLGAEGLAKLAKKLEDAKAKNDAPIPEEVLNQWPVPGVTSIHFIESATARSGSARKLGVSKNKAQMVIDAEKSDSPLFLQFESVPSNFVSISVLLVTSGIPVEHRPLLSLFIDNFFNTPIMHEGQKVDFEAVVQELEKDTISYSISGGARIGDAEGVVIQFQVEPEKYGRAIEWIRALMYDSVFDETRLRAGVTKILADIPESKRNGNTMMYAADNMIHLAPESISKARGTLVKAVYMKHIKKLLQDNPAEVITMLESVRKSLFTFANMRILVIADIEGNKLPSPVTSWSPLLKSPCLGDTSIPPSPITKQFDRLSPSGQNPGRVGAIIIPMPTVDSSFLLSSATGPRSYDDPRLPALLVAVSYLDAVEGPLWRAVRGTGLAYGTGFTRDLESGFMQFRVYRSPDAAKAFTASASIVQDFITGKTAFEPSALEGAVSGIVVGVADEQTTMGAAAQLSFINSVLRGVGPEYNAELLREVREVTVEDIQNAMKEVLMPIFTPGKANIVATCAPILEAGLTAELGRIGFETAVKRLNEFSTAEEYGVRGEEDEVVTDYEEEEEEEEEDGLDSSSGEEEEEED